MHFWPEIDLGQPVSLHHTHGLPLPKKKLGRDTVRKLSLFTPPVGAQSGHLPSSRRPPSRPAFGLTTVIAVSNFLTVPRIWRTSFEVAFSSRAGALGCDKVTPRAKPSCFAKRLRQRRRRRAEGRVNLGAVWYQPVVANHAKAATTHSMRIRRHRNSFGAAWLWRRIFICFPISPAFNRQALHFAATCMVPDYNLNRQQCHNWQRRN